MIKKIEDMDFYDLLNLRIDASPKDIENSYLLAVATYHREGLASYGALGEADRGLMLDKVEEAFQTLRDPEKKKAYDLLVCAAHPEFRQRAFFRRSIGKLDIEDASEEENLWDKLKAAVHLPWHRRDGHEAGKNGHEENRIPKDFYYYGDYLRKVRERRGLSREDISERCGISPEELESLEKDNSPFVPHARGWLEGLKRYARCLGLGSLPRGGSPFSDRLDK